MFIPSLWVACDELSRRKGKGLRTGLDSSLCIVISGLLRERAGLQATTAELLNCLAGGQLVGRRCGENALGSCVGAAAACAGLGTALPSQDRGWEGHGVAQGTQFEGRTSGYVVWRSCISKII